MDTLDTKAVNEPSRIFTVPGEGPYYWKYYDACVQNGGFLIAKALVGAFSVKLCEGSLTALLDTRHLFMSRYNIMELEKPAARGRASLWSPWSAVSSRPRIMSELHSSGQTRQKWA